MNKGLLLVVSILFLCGCQSVDLRGDMGNYSLADQAKGKEILNQSAQQSGVLENWPKYSKMDVLATDHWSSMVFRWMSPIQIPNQKIEFEFSLNPNDSLMTFIDGKNPGDSIGLKGDKTYKIIKGQTIQKNFKDAYTYLHHVHNYFFFPQTIKDFPFIIYLGEGKFKGQTYDKVFVSTSDSLANVKEDQYIAWVNQQTERIDFIEFTIRKVMPSFRGVIAYTDYRLVNGIWLPFEIALPQAMGSNSLFHRLTVESVKLQ